MRKVLPPRQMWLCFGSLCVASLSKLATAESFTRCEPVSLERDCIPGSGSSSILTGNPINISMAPGSGDVVAFNWPVKNCFSRSNQLRGQVFLIVDNSKSEETTDTDTLRAPVVKAFIDNFVARAESTVAFGLSQTNAAYPKIAVMNYNGRSGLESSTDAIDELNYKFDPDYCVKTTDAFSSSQAIERWGTPSDAVKYSICEFLPFTAAATSAAVENMKKFIDFSAAMPRGSTDFTYFFRGALKAFNEITNTSNVGRNVVVVTDGLPNIPKYVAASTCRNSARLKNESITTGLRLGKNQDFCVDRQTPTAIVQAHAEALTPRFKEINVHHILFTQNQTAYFDYDDSGKPEINPAGFLIENSARTGNGKVKFNYAPSQEILRTKLDSIFEQFDKNSLRFVKVKVTPSSGPTLEYNAVSPAAPGSNFDIKFVGLKTGTNKVEVTPFYQDGRSSDSVILNLIVGPATDTLFTCSSVDGGRTVDGDLKGSQNPKGDGFYAEPSASGDFRDYRNADEGNNLSRDVFGVVGDDRNLEKLTRLRLQGGTGNCGTLVGFLDFNSFRGLLLLFSIILSPLLMVHILGRRFLRRSEKIKL